MTTPEHPPHDRPFPQLADDLFHGRSGGANILERMQDQAERLGGWVEPILFAGEEQDNQAGYRLAWPRPVEIDPDEMDVCSVSLVYHKDGRFDLVSAGGRQEMPAFSLNLLYAACRTPLVDRVNCSAVRTGNHIYLTAARQLFAMLHPLFWAYHEDLRRNGWVNLAEVDISVDRNRQYYQGFAPIPDGFARKSLAWRRNWQDLPAGRAWEQCTVEVCLQTDSSVHISGSDKASVVLPPEKWKDPGTLQKAIDKAVAHPRVVQHTAASSRVRE